LALAIRAISGLSRQGLGANDKVGRIEDMALDEIKHRAINLRPLRLHQKEYELGRSVASSLSDVRYFSIAAVAARATGERNHDSIVAAQEQVDEEDLQR